MSSAANIQIKIDTTEAERADRVLEALKNTSDKLYKALNDLDSGTSFDRLNSAVVGANTHIGRLEAANDAVAGSLDRTSTQAADTGRALTLVDTGADSASRALVAVTTASESSSRALVLVGTEGAATGRKLDASFDQIQQSAIDAGRGVMGLDAANDNLTAAARQAAAGAEAQAKATRGATTATEAQTKSNGLAARGFDAVKLAIAGAVLSLATLVKNAFSAADEFKSMEATLRIVTDSTEEYQRANDGLIASARDSRTALSDVVSLYAATNQPLKEMGFNQREIVLSTELVTKALKIGGGTAVGHAAAMGQLIQALGSGVLRGEEFNSVMEGGRGIAIQLAEGLDVPIGALRGMAEQGELTADVVIQAMLDQQRVIESTFATLPVTAAQAWQLVKNSATLAIGQIDSAFGVSDAWADLLVGVADSIDVVAQNLHVVEGAITVVAAVMTGKLIAAGVTYIAQKAAIIAAERTHSAAMVENATRQAVLATGASATAAAQLGAAASTRALGVAATASAVGMRGLSAAMALVGGPIGLIVAAAAALYAYREEIYESVTATGSAERAVRLHAEAIDLIRGGTEDYRDASVEARAETEKAIAAEIRSGQAKLLTLKSTSALLLVMSESNGSLRDGTKATTQEVENATAAYEAQQARVDELISEFDLFIDAVDKTGVATEKAAGKSEVLTDEFGRSAEEAAAATTIYTDQIAALDLQILGYERGADAAFRHEQALKNLTPKQIDDLVATRDRAEALREASEVSDEHTKALGEAEAEFDSLRQAQALQHAELTQGADAARRLELSYRDGYTPALIEGTIATENNMRAQEALSDAAGQVFDAVLEGQNPLKEMGDIAKDWLLDMVSTFYSNKIVAYFTGEGATGVQGMFDDVLGSLQSMFGGGASAAGTATTTFNGAAGALEAFGGAGDAVTASAGAATSGLSGISAALSANIAPIGLFVAGIAAVSKGLGSTAQMIDSGFEVGFDNGQVIGNDYEDYEQERSGFRGTKSWTVFSELNTVVAKKVGDYFTAMNNSIVEQAEILGVAGADGILEGFSVAIQRISNSDNGDLLGEFLIDSTAQAYDYAFAQLSPELQAIVGEGLSVMEKPTRDFVGSMSSYGSAFSGGAARWLEATEAANQKYAEELAIWEANNEGIIDGIADLTEVALTIMPVMQAVGLAVYDSTQTQLVAADTLTDALGGVENATAALSLLQSEFVPIAEQNAIALSDANDRLIDWNSSLGLSGDQMITTREGTLAHIRDLEAQSTAHALAAIALQNSGTATDEQVAASDALTESLADETAAAYANLDAIVLVENEQRRQIESTNALAEAGQMLGFEFDALAPAAYQASDAIIEMAGGMDEFRTKTGQLYDLLYTKQEQQDIALAQAAISLDGYNQLLGLSGEQSIQTAADLQVYMDGLDQSSPLYASQLAILLNMAPALTAVNDSGQNTTDILNGLDPALAGVAGVGAEATATVNDFGDGLVNLQQVAGTTTTLFDAFNEQIGLSGGTAITSEADLRTYIAGMEATQQTSSQAYLDAVALSEAMAAMSGQGLILNDVIDTLPVHLQDAYAAMDFAAMGTSATALAAAGDVEGASTVIDAALAGVSDELDYTTGQADVLNAALAEAGLSAVTTTDQLQNHTDALDLNTVAGQTALAAIENFVHGIDTATINTGIVTDTTDSYNVSLANLDEVVKVNIATTGTSIEATGTHSSTLETNIDATTRAAEAIDGMAASATALTESNTSLMATVDQLPTNTADAFEQINLQGQATGESLIASAGVIDAATVAANDSLAVMADTTGLMMGAATDYVNTASATMTSIFQTLGDSMIAVAGQIGAATDSANGSLAGFGGAINGTASAASSAANVAGGAASSASSSADKAANYAGSASYEAGRAADYAGSAASASWRAADAASSAASAAWRAAESSASTGSYSTGLDRVVEAERLVTVHRDEMIPTPAISNQLRAMGITATSIPDDLGASVSVAPAVSVTNNNGGGNAALIAKIEQLTAEVRAAKRQANENAQSATGVLGYIAEKSNAQVVKLAESARAAELASRTREAG